MKTTILKRSCVIDGHKTSISLEDAFWSELRQLARARNIRVSDLISQVNEQRQRGNLSSALRLFILQIYLDVRAAQRPADTPEHRSAA